MRTTTTLLAILLALSPAALADDKECPVKRSLIGLDRLHERGDWPGGRGVSSLACLGFLGAGHTHRYGRFKGTVKEYMKRQLRAQTPDGRLGQRASLRDHAVATLALTEGYGLTKSPLLRGAAIKAMEYLAGQLRERSRWAHLEPDGYPPLGGVIWGAAALACARRHELSIPQLAAARAAGLDFTERALRSGARRRAALAAARYLCGADLLDPQIAAVTADLSRRPAEAARAMGAIEHWAATCLMRNHGGDAWKVWRAHIEPRLIATQLRQPDQPLTGHWKPTRDGDEQLGRVALAAIHTLTLQQRGRFARALR